MLSGVVRVVGAHVLNGALRGGAESMYAVIAAYRVTPPASAPSVEAFRNAVRLVDDPTARIEHVSVVRTRDEIAAVMFVTAADANTALEAAQRAAIAAATCSDSMHLVSVSLRLPEET
jgi:hypothetical protein